MEHPNQVDAETSETTGGEESQSGMSDACHHALQSDTGQRSGGEIMNDDCVENSRTDSNTDHESSAICKDAKSDVQDDTKQENAILKGDIDNRTNICVTGKDAKCDDSKMDMPLTSVKISSSTMPDVQSKIKIADDDDGDWVDAQDMIEDEEEETENFMDASDQMIPEPSQDGVPCADRDQISTQSQDSEPSDKASSTTESQVTAEPVAINQSQTNDEQDEQVVRSKYSNISSQSNLQSKGKVEYGQGDAEAFVTKALEGEEGEENKEEEKGEEIEIDEIARLEMEAAMTEEEREVSYKFGNGIYILCALESN